VRTILVVGGGYAGFYTAWKLEKKLRRDEARVVVVDPRPYMTYQPFLPEVLAGSIEARHAAVSLRRHLRRTRLISGRSPRLTTRTGRPPCSRPRARGSRSATTSSSSPPAR
jgi:NADH dehydrogenase